MKKISTPIRYSKNQTWDEKIADVEKAILAAHEMNEAMYAAHGGRMPPEWEWFGAFARVETIMLHWIGITHTARAREIAKAKRRKEGLRHAR